VGRAEGIFQDDPLGDRFSVDEVFLEDAFESFWGHFSVPDTVWVDNNPRTTCADAKAVCFGSECEDLRFFESLFDLNPEGLAGREICAIGAKANEEMAFRLSDWKIGKALGFREHHSV